jgi:hypothetical protein
MKKNIFSKLMFALAMVVSATVLSSCDKLANMDNGTFLGDMVISGPGVSDHKLTIEMESTVQLYCAEKFSGMNDVVWYSLDENIVKVDARSGVITPVAPGTAMVKAYTDTEPVRQGDFVEVTVIPKGLSIVNDALDQSLAD